MTLNAHIQPKHTGVVSMALTISERIRITKNRVRFLNHVGINNKVFHDNHLTFFVVSLVDNYKYSR